MKPLEHAPHASRRSRREFLKASAAAGGGLVLGVVLPDALAGPAWAQAKGAAAAASMPNAWVRIGADNSVTILSARSEMGQGVYTAMPTLVAEELEVDLHKVKVEIAPAGEPYINAMLGGQLTGGSTSVAEGFDKLRIAGAQARTMLVAAAAQKWAVDASGCRAQNGSVQGPSGQKATYGELAEAASRLPVPKDVKLKEPAEWKYIGKPINRLDSPGKINGTAEFGIDVKLPGMLYAALAQCPVIGGKVASLDDAKAKSLPGVKHVVQIADGVAVVADTWWRAKVARDALLIKWDEGAGKSLDSAGISSALKAAAAKPGAVVKKQGDVDEGLRGAAKKVEAVYELPFLAHVPMEPMNFTADVRKDSCLVYGPTQFQQLAAGVAAQVTGLKPEQITVRTTFLGGGFGRRIDVDFIAQAVEISKAVGAPVKLALDARGRHHPRLLPAHQLPPVLGRARRAGQAGGRQVPHDLALGDRAPLPRVCQGRHRSVHDRGRDAGLRHSPPARGRGDPRHRRARGLLAFGLARPQRLRHRVVHGRDGGGRGQGPVRVPPRAFSTSILASSTCSSWPP